MERTLVDVAWCAGLYEGEGTIVYGESRKGPLTIRISSTDRDVLELMLNRSGVGVIYGPYSPNGFGVKPYYEWVLRGRKAVALLTEMMPFLGQRRAARAAEKIALWDSRPRREVADQEAMRADRASGMTYVEIGLKHGVSHARAFQICRDGKVMPRRTRAVAE